MAGVLGNNYITSVTAKIYLSGTGMGAMSVQNGPVLQFTATAIVGNSSNPAGSDINSAVAAASSAAAALMIAAAPLATIQAWNTGGM